MARRRERIEQPAPGEGEVHVQTAVMRMFEHHGVDVDGFIANVRDRRLSNCTRDRFDGIRTANAYPDLPETHGLITWRRRLRAYSLDLAHVILHASDNLEVHYWSSVGRGLAQIRFDGVELPETMMGMLAGEPLSRVTDHPWLQDPSIVIRRATITRRRPDLIVGPGSDRPSMLQFQIEMPTERRPDHR